jgi:hypothetical protein
MAGSNSLAAAGLRVGTAQNVRLPSPRMRRLSAKWLVAPVFAIELTRAFVPSGWRIYNRTKRVAISTALKWNCSIGRRPIPAAIW